MSFDVTLTREEVRLAAVRGVWRHVESGMHRVNGAPIRQQHIPIGWANEIEAACAELAVARMSNRYWTGIQFPTGAAGADVGHNIDVRWTDRDDGRLLVKDWDDPAHIYVLVLGRAPLMRIVGYIRGEDAKVDRYWDESLPRPCFAVPQSELTAIGPQVLA